MTRVEEPTSILSPGDAHVVALAPRVPICDRAYQTGRASAQAVR